MPSPKRAKSKPAPRRNAPDLAPELPEVHNVAETFGIVEIVVRDQIMENLALQQTTASSVVLEGCILNRVDLSESKIGSLRLKDTRLTDCDLANTECLRLVVVRSEFVGCRMTGFQAVGSDCRDLLVSEGDQRYSRWTQGRFVASEFVACNFQDADWQECDLRGAIFGRCNLRNADLTSSVLQDTDLRGSQIEGLKVGAKDLYGAIVDPAQAMQFAALLGLKIR